MGFGGETGSGPVGQVLTFSQQMTTQIPFYRLSSPSVSDGDFAFPTIAEGTFSPVEKRRPKCARPLIPRIRLFELVIKWIDIDPYSYGSDVIADFYAFGTDATLMVSERLRRFLEVANFRELQFGPVRMVQDPKLRRPTRITSRTKKRVWLPYEGPPLFELKVLGNAQVDLELNNFELSDHVKCHTCNHVITLLLRPPERFKDPWIVRRTDWDGSDFFQLSNPVLVRNGAGPSYFVVESVKDAMNAQQFTNI